MRQSDHLSHSADRTRRSWTIATMVSGLLLVSSTTAQAYIGPGTGITAVGSVLALLAGLVLAIVGFLWFPVRRLIRRWRKSPAESGLSDSAAQAEDQPAIPRHKEPAP